MNDLQWFGLFMVIFGLLAAFALCWWFEIREKECNRTWHFYPMPSTAGNFKWYIIVMRSKLYGID
jgi:hypothetical protein